MQLSLQGFSSLVGNMGAVAQGACASLADLTVGSVTRALLEAAASVALWLQYLVLQVMAMTRLATSSGADVDSWVADFGLSRLGGTASSGQVTMSCFSYASQSAIVPAGTLVRLGSGTATFAVVADPSNAAWSAAGGFYVRQAGSPAITVPVQATEVGSAGNVQPGTVNLLAQSVSGIDTVTNALALTGGADAESDVALKARFVPYINSRAQATVTAIESAIAGVQQGLSYAVEENVDTAGAPRAGFFVVVVDDGSGSPPASLITTVSEAVDAVRPVGTGFAVVGPTLIPASIDLTLVLAPGADGAVVRGAASAAITAYVDALPIGAPLAFSRLAGLAYAADPTVTNVLGLTVNAGTGDLGGGVGQVVRISTLTVS